MEQRAERPFQVPALSVACLLKWTLYGVHPGDALHSCLRGEFFNAIFRLDNNNIGAVRDLACFIAWDLPRDCAGNPERVSAWAGLRTHERSQRLVGWDPFKHFNDEQTVGIVRILGDNASDDLEALTDEECASRIQSLRATRTEGMNQ